MEELKTWHIRRGGNKDSKGRRRKHRGMPFACLVTDGTFMGVSSCCKEDKYSKAKAVEIAVGRMEKMRERDCLEQEREIDPPWRLRKAVKRMIAHFELEINLVEYDPKWDFELGDRIQLKPHVTAEDIGCCSLDFERISTVFRYEKLTEGSSIELYNVSVPKKFITKVK